MPGSSLQLLIFLNFFISLPQADKIPSSKKTHDEKIQNGVGVNHGNGDSARTKFFHLSDPINGHNGGGVKPVDPDYPDNPQQLAQNGVHSTTTTNGHGSEPEDRGVNYHPFIVTHVNPRKKAASAAENGDKECWSKKCLDNWQMSFKQTVKWSELANVKNLEIDGVSRLRVRQDNISFEYNLYEQRNAAAAAESEEAVAAQKKKKETRQSEI